MRSSCVVGSAADPKDQRPEEVAAVAGSYTGRYLKQMLAKSSEGQREAAQ